MPITQLTQQILIIKEAWNEFKVVQKIWFSMWYYKLLVIKMNSNFCIANSNKEWIPSKRHMLAPKWKHLGEHTSTLSIKLFLYTFIADLKKSPSTRDSIGGYTY